MSKKYLVIEKIVERYDEDENDIRINNIKCEGLVDCFIKLYGKDGLEELVLKDLSNIKEKDIIESLNNYDYEDEDRVIYIEDENGKCLYKNYVEIKNIK